MAIFDRRTMLIATALMGAVALAGCKTKGAGAAAGDMSMGNAAAKVTVVEYASVTCPHCADWNAEVFPAFKAKYIDTGKVHYTFRELPTPPIDVATAGFLMARCAGPDKYFEIVDAIMRSQHEMFANQDTSNARPVLLRIARSAGMSEQQFDTCVTDENAIKAFSDRVKAAQDAGIDGTPAFRINGQDKGWTAPPTLAQMDAAIQPLL